MNPSPAPHRSPLPLVMLGGLLMLAGGLVLAGVGYERAYAGRMYPGVTILSLPVGGQTYQDAWRMMSARATEILDRPIELKYSDGATELVTPRRLSLRLDADALVAEAYERGRTGTLWQRWSNIVLLRTTGAALAFKPEFATDTLLTALESSFTKHEKPPQNATLTEANGALVIAPEQSGTRVDRAAFSGEIEAAFASLNLPTRVAVPIETVAPTVTTADLTPILPEAQRLTSVPLTITARDRTFTVSPVALATWIVADTSHLPPTLSWSKDAIATYLGKIVTKIDAPMAPRKINQQTGAVIADGAVGYKLDRAAAAASILAALTARQSGGSLQPITTDPVALTVAELPIEDKVITPPFTPGLYPGKYIEVNLTEQALYQWEGTNQLASYPVSTGKWSTPTPEGVFYVGNHISYAYSREFNLYMPWWLGLAVNPDGSGQQGYGIHELPEWKGGRKEGEGHLGTPVSHGCIRLGIGPAEAVYNWADDGTPVYIHK